MDNEPASRVNARRVLAAEARAIVSLSNRLDESFDRTVALLLGCTGKAVVTGMGKSGHVGRKIAATLASTGTPAFFLHPAEALHGDLGMASPSDIALVLSNSGESDELRGLLPALRRRVTHLVAVTGNPGSTLAAAADIVLEIGVEREACPLNLAPTTSTTVMLALGDALAVAVMQERGFASEDYAKLHPAGSLGRRLLLRVSDIVRSGADMAVVGEDATVHETLTAVTKAGAGLACVVDHAGRLTGVFSDGDSRRLFVSEGLESWNRRVGDVMTRSPRTLVGDPLAAETLADFENGPLRFGDLPVLAEDGRPVGVLALKDLIRAGIVQID